MKNQLCISASWGTHKDRRNNFMTFPQVGFCLLVGCRSSWPCPCPLNQAWGLGGVQALLGSCVYFCRIRNNKPLASLHKSIRTKVSKSQSQGLASLDFEIQSRSTSKYSVFLCGKVNEFLPELRIVHHPCKSNLYLHVTNGGESLDKERS